MVSNERALVIAFVILLSLPNLHAQVSQPYTLYGFVYQNDGITPQQDADVTLTHDGEQPSTTTNVYGEYTFDLSELTDGYSSGDTLWITATYNDFGDTITEIVGTASPQRVSDIILDITAPQPGPSVPYTIYGFVYQNDGVTPQQDADVTLTHDDEQLSTTTNVYGEYLFDLAELPGGYSAGITLEIIAGYDGLMDRSIEIVDGSSPQMVTGLVLGPPIFITLHPNPTQGGKDVKIWIETVSDAVVTVELNGTPIAIAHLGNGNYSGMITAPALEGDYPVTAVVIDPQEMAAQDTEILTVDNTPPFILINHPQNNSVTGQSIQAIEGITEINTNVVVNGINATVIKGIFNSTVVLEYGENTIEITATDSAGNTNTLEITVLYSTLYISSIQVNSIQPGEIVTIRIEVMSLLLVQSTVSEITDPGGSIQTHSMSNISNVYTTTIQDLTEVGDYNVTVYVTDTAGNIANRSAWFEVFTTRDFYGDIITADDQPLHTEFELYKPGTDTLLKNFATDTDGIYHVTVHNRDYDMLLRFSDMEIRLNNLDFSSIDNDPIDLDIVEGSDVDIANMVPILGFAAKTDISSNGFIGIEYGGGVNSEDMIRVYGCSDWRYTQRICNSEWIGLDTTINKVSNKVTANITGFSGAYMAIEVLRCGNGMCESNYGESCSTCPLDCGICPTGAGGGGRTDLSDLEEMIRDQTEKIEELERQLNETMAVGGDVTDILKRIEEQSRTINEVKEILQRGEEALSIVSGMEIISADMYPGETIETSVHVRNILNRTSAIVVNVTGNLADIITIENPRIILGAGEEADIRLIIHVPIETIPGTYPGGIVGRLEEHSTSFAVPVNIRVLPPLEGLMRLDIKLQDKEIRPGETLGIWVDIYNKGSDRDANLSLRLVDMNTHKVISMEEYNLSVGKTLSIIKKLYIPQNITDGKYTVEGIAIYLGVGNRTQEVGDREYLIIKRPFFSSTLLGIPIWLLLVGFFILAIVYTAFIIRKRQEAKKRRYTETIEFATLPQPGPRAGFIGRIAETGIRAFINIDALQIHALVAGATGSGKTVAVQVMVEEALQKGISVIVFDPTAQWSGFLRANKDKKMFRLYKKFRMSNSAAKAFNGNVYTVDDPLKGIELKKYMRKGEITIFCIHKLNPKDTDTFVENTIGEIFRSDLEESKELKTLIVYDEVHRLLPKFGGAGGGFTSIERAVREFRKWGIGLILISQVLSDFMGEIKANIGTEVQMRTRYEGDLERIKIKYGEDILKSVIKASIGTGMIQNTEYNRGRPYFVSYRPLLHNHSRLSDDVLNLYTKYNLKVEGLRDKLQVIRETGGDIFDLELELNLAVENVKRGSFDIVEMYLESLVPRIDADYKQSGESARRRFEEKKRKEKLREHVKWVHPPLSENVEKKERIKPISGEGTRLKQRGKDMGGITKEAREITKEAKMNFDEMPVENAGLDDIDEIKIKEFLKRRAQRSNTQIPEFSVKEVLEKFNGGVKKDGMPAPTNTGLLFFGKDPQRFIPHSEIKAARFKGRDMGEFMDESRIKGTLPEIINGAERFIRRNTRKAMKIIDFERFDIFEYPYGAIREAIVNSLAHRDYFMSGATVRILIFDDRIEIDNPGGLIGGLTVDTMKGKHITRNRLFCNLLYEIGEMEEYGTGIGKMKNLMKEHGLKEPVFEEDAGFFKVTFYGPGDNILDLVPSPERKTNLSHLNERQVKALEHIYKAGSITTEGYITLFDVPGVTAGEELDELIKHKLVKAVKDGVKTRYVST